MLIYKITNSINSKVYIGQTIYSMKHRWSQHKSAANKRSNLYISRSMKKHGVENFKVEMIAWATNITELNYLEWLHIHKHDSIMPNGYNMMEGGGAAGKRSAETCKNISTAQKKYFETHLNPRSRQVIDIVTKQTWETAKAAAIANNIHTNNIRPKLLGKAGNETNLRYVGMEDVYKPFVGPVKRQVIDIVTKETWDSCASAAKVLGVSSKKLSNKLKGVSGNETNLRFVGMEDICKPLTKLAKRQVIDIVTGQTWKTATECAKYFNMHIPTLNGKLLGKRGNDTNLRYVGMEDVYKPLIRPNKKPVIDIVTGQTWGYIKECAKDLGINYNTLNSKLNGSNPNNTNLRYK